MRTLYGDAELHEAMTELKSFLAPLGINSRDAALRWICWHSCLDEGDAIILGASRLEQVSQNVRSIGDGKLPEQVVEATEKVWGLLKESRGGIL